MVSLIEIGATVVFQKAQNQKQTHIVDMGEVKLWCCQKRHWLKFSGPVKCSTNEPKTHIIATWTNRWPNGRHQSVTDWSGPNFPAIFALIALSVSVLSMSVVKQWHVTKNLWHITWCLTQIHDVTHLFSRKVSKKIIFFRKLPPFLGTILYRTIQDQSVIYWLSQNQGSADRSKSLKV